MPMHDWTRIDPNDYHDFHAAWIVAIRTALNSGLLPADYFALAEHVVPPVIPDVLTLERPGRVKGAADANGTGGEVAVETAARTLTAAPPQVRFAATGDPRRLRPSPRRVAVRYARNRRLVAVVEIVSPANKAKAVEFRDFVGKLVALLRQGIHALVIDPFPPTARDPGGVHPAVWKAVVKKPELPALDKPLTLASYLATGEGFRAFVEPVAVGDRLPDMPLFLEPDLYVNVPLETTYQTAWAGFPSFLRGLVEGPTA